MLKQVRIGGLHRWEPAKSDAENCFVLKILIADDGSDMCAGYDDNDDDDEEEEEEEDYHEHDNT